MAAQYPGSVLQPYGAELRVSALTACSLVAITERKPLGERQRSAGSQGEPGKPPEAATGGQEGCRKAVLR